MLGQRVGDNQAATHYRSDRISAVNGQYFFSTREGTLEGPTSPASMPNARWRNTSPACARRQVDGARGAVTAS